MAEEITKYVTSVTFDARKAIKQLEAYEKRQQQFVNREVVATTKATIAKINSEQKVLNAKERLRKKEAADKAKAEAKAKAAQVKFDRWRDNQFRSVWFDRLSLDQKNELKRVLMAKKANDEIVADFRKAQLLMKRDADRAKRASRAKGKGGSRFDSAMGILPLGAAGGLAAAGVAAPLVVAAGAALGGGMAIRSGTQNVKDLQRDAMLAGTSTQALQTLTIESRGMQSQEKSADMLKDVGDKLGELSEATVDKNGKLQGGGQAMDMVRLLVKTGVFKSEKAAADKLTGMSSTEALKFITESLRGKGVDDKKLTFATESLANDLSLLVKDMLNNADKRASALGAGKGRILSDEDIASISAVGEMISSIASGFKGLTTSFTKGFAKALSPEAQKALSAAGSAISSAIHSLVEGLGWLTGALLDFQSLWLRLTFSITDFVSNTFSGVREFISSVKNGLSSVKEMFLSFIVSIGEGISKLPSILSKVLGNTTIGKALGFGEEQGDTKAFKEWKDNVISLPILMRGKGAGMAPELPPKADLASVRNTAREPITIINQLDGEEVSRRVVHSSEFQQGVLNEIAYYQS